MPKPSKDLFSLCIPQFTFKSMIPENKKPKSRIAFSNSLRENGMFLQAAKDSILWFDMNSGIKKVVSTTDVQQIEITTPRRAKLRGLFGEMIGGAVGIVIGYCLGDDSMEKLSYAGILGVSAAYAGQLIGYHSGNKDIYIFHFQSQMSQY